MAQQQEPVSASAAANDLHNRVSVDMEARVYAAFEQEEQRAERQMLAARHERFDCKVPGCESKYATSG
jgi:hypothetical protein